jgi:hypothetical protein
MSSSTRNTKSVKAARSVGEETAVMVVVAALGVGAALLLVVSALVVLAGSAAVVRARVGKTVHGEMGSGQEVSGTNRVVSALWGISHAVIARRHAQVEETGVSVLRLAIVHGLVGMVVSAVSSARPCRRGSK